MWVTSGSSCDRGIWAKRVVACGPNETRVTFASGTRLSDAESASELDDGCHEPRGGQGLWIVRGGWVGRLTSERSSGRHRCAAQAGSSDGGCARRFNRLVRWLCLAPDDCLQVSFFRAIFCTPKETSKTRESRDPPGVSRNVPQAWKATFFEHRLRRHGRQVQHAGDGARAENRPPPLGRTQHANAPPVPERLGGRTLFYAPHMALCSAEPASPPSARHYRQFRAHHV